MGIYSGQNNMFMAMRSIDPASGYDDGEYSAQIVMIENVQNQMSMFNGVILSDIQEAEMRIAGADQEEIQAFTEGVIGDVLSKIKEMFKKLWAKIKAIFQGFMARLEAQFGKNNKKLVEKYRKLVSTKDLTDFEPKHRKKKADPPGFEGVGTALNNNMNTGKILNANKTAADLDKIISDWDEEKEADTYVKALGCSDIQNWDSFEKDFMDHCFDDEDTDKVSIYDIMSKLIAFKDIRRDWDKCTKSLDKAMNKIVDQIEKDITNFSREFPNGRSDQYAKAYKLGVDASATTGSKDQRYDHSTYDVDDQGDEVTSGNGKTKLQVSDATADNSSEDSLAARYQKALSIVSKHAHLGQQIATKYTKCVIKVLDFGNKQNRSIFAKAVAYRRNKNEEVMMEAMAELVEWEADY